MLLVLAAEEVQRYSQVRRALPDPSPKVLTQTLRALDRDGFLTRTVRSIAPPHVEYALTPLGRSLVCALRVLTAWAEEHIDAVHAARTQATAAEIPWLEPRGSDPQAHFRSRGRRGPPRPPPRAPTGR